MDTNLYFGYIRFDTRGEMYDNLIAREVLNDIKDFFDVRLEVAEYMKLSIGHENIFKYGSIKSDAIDNYDINDTNSVVYLRTYARDTRFKHLVNHLIEKSNSRDEIYRELVDNLKMHFSGNYITSTQSAPEICSVNYQLDFRFNSKFESVDIKLNTTKESKLAVHSANARMIAHLFATDTYTDNGIFYIQKLLKDTIKGKYNQSEYPGINELIVEAKKFFLNSQHLYKDIDELLSLDRLTMFFNRYGGDEGIYIGIEDSLLMLLGYKDLVIHELANKDTNK